MILAVGFTILSFSFAFDVRGHGDDTVVMTVAHVDVSIDPFLIVSGVCSPSVVASGARFEADNLLGANDVADPDDSSGSPSSRPSTNVGVVSPTIVYFVLG